MFQRLLASSALLLGTAALATPTTGLAQIQDQPPQESPEDAEAQAPVGDAAATQDEAATAEEAPSDGSEAEAAPGDDQVVGGLEEVIVTARKRSKAEMSQDVPISMSALSGAQLDTKRRAPAQQRQTG